MKVNLKLYGGDAKEEIHFDDEDFFSLDHTLAKIIYPSLLEFKNNRMNGVPLYDVDDLPEEMRDGIEVGNPISLDDEETNLKTTDWEGWKWIMDQMIEAFRVIANDEIRYDDEGLYDRVKNGLRLFGKYFMALWT